MALVLLHATIPFLAARLKSAEDEYDESSAALPAADGTDAPKALSESSSPGYARIHSAFNSAYDLEEVFMASVAPVPADTLATPPVSCAEHVCSGSGLSMPEGATTVQAPADRHWSSEHDSVGESRRAGPGGRSSTADFISISAIRKYCWDYSVTRPYTRCMSYWHILWRSPRMLQLARWLPVATQLHLAMFYIFGFYYEFPKRLTGTQYIYVGSSQVPRRYFGAMGILLLVQTLVGVSNMYRCARLSTSAAPWQQHHPLLALVWVKT